VAASTADSTVRVTDGTEYNGYEIAEIGLVQAADVDGAGAKSFTVNGLLNGGKVALEQGSSKDYTATLTGGVNGAEDPVNDEPDYATVEDGKITVETKHLKKDDKGNPVDTEFTLRVTINATGEVLE